jgi:mycothione reductase
MTEHFDLVIIGAGSGNMLFGHADLSDWRVAIVERDRFGGTCVNRGCIPSKMLVHTADVADTVREAERFGVHAHLDRVDWPAVRDRIWTRIDPLHGSASHYREGRGVSVFNAPSRFTGFKRLDVGGETITAERFVLAAGARTTIPDLPGLADVGYETSGTIMRRPKEPGRLTILGGGFVAAELGHVFAALGTEVTICARDNRLLPREDTDIAYAFTNKAREWATLELDTTAQRVERAGDGIRLTLRRDGQDITVDGDVLLVAVGRQPNGDVLDVSKTGVETDDGRVIVDDTFSTNVDGIWAFGDLTSRHQLKHCANRQGRIVAHNLCHPDDLQHASKVPVPHAVFTNPQIAGIGPTEADLRDAGRSYVTTQRRYSSVAYGWALEDTSSFLKVIGDPESRCLIAAHIIGPDASNLIQPLVQAMYLGNTVDQVAHDVIYIHPALAEVVENACIDLVQLFP